VRKKDSGRIYAMKVLTKASIIRRNQVEHTRTERSVLGRIVHPFIVGLSYAFQTEDKVGAGALGGARGRGKGLAGAVCVLGEVGLREGARLCVCKCVCSSATGLLRWHVRWWREGEAGAVTHDVSISAPPHPSR
jgi:serine/threonine protein kinase